MLFASFRRHPSFLWVLFAIETLGNFSHYGVRMLLILYMSLKLGMEDQSAYELYGRFVALIYLMPMLGGALADRFGQGRFFLYLGGFLTAGGQFLLTWSHEGAFFIGLSSMAAGYGFFKPNLMRQMNSLYEGHDIRREAGFTLFFVASNTGALLAAVCCGVIGYEFGWRWGFALAGGMMGVNLLLIAKYHREFHSLPVQDDLPHRGIQIGLLLGLGLLVLGGGIALADENLFDHIGVFVLIAIGLSLSWITMRVKRHERSLIALIMILMIFHTFFFALFEQIGGSINLFIERIVDRSWGGFIIPTPWFQSLNPIMVIGFAPIISIIWSILARRGQDLSVPAKIVLSFVTLTAGFFMLYLGAHWPSTEKKVAIIWLLGGIFLQTLGEIFIAPVSLSTITRISPPQYVGYFIGCYFLSVSVGNYLAGKIASWSLVIPAGLQRPGILFAYGEGFKSLSLMSCLFLGLVIACFPYLARNLKMK